MTDQMPTATDARRLDQTTYAELQEIAARYPQPRSGLLPMLHLVQSVQGHVTPEGIEACAEILGLSTADVSGVATFYTMYKRRPVGDYHVGVCTNTLCAVMGGDAIFDALKDHLGVGNDETAPRRDADTATVSLEHVECNAACDYAPVVMVNWEFMDNQTPESARQLVDDLRAGREVRSTRGPRLCTWRQAERVLAGFPDGLADEGPAAGPASLVGLEIARERNWRAPDADTGTRTSEEPDTAGEAAEEADTRRAGAETEVSEAPADVKHSVAEGDERGTSERPSAQSGAAEPPEGNTGREDAK